MLKYNYVIHTFKWMIRNSLTLFKLSTIYLLFAIPAFLYAVPYTGWETYSSYSELYMNGNKVFDSRFDSGSFPRYFNDSEKIDYALFLSEYYISKDDRAKLNKLKIHLYSVPDYSLAVSLIDFFWYSSKKKYDKAEHIISDYLKREKNLYHSLLASSVLELVGENKTLSEESASSLRKFRCKVSEPYYSLCKILRLVERIEDLSILSSNIYYDYMRIDKEMASFYEDPRLYYLYFFSKVFSELPIKLATLGFASEAAYFQKMLIQSENLYALNVKSYERLSYYQLLLDELDNAETTLKLIVDRLNSAPLTKNNILLKLGAIAYYRKDYHKSLDYYLSLNINSWSRYLINPFFGEPMTINGVRDLLSVFIWKSKSSLKAIEALNSIQSQKEITEEDLFIRLRIAHILMDEKPKVAEKISEEIIYIAQSRGWKRIEYAATLMNGFCHILMKSYRKAVIQFTKSYGILRDSDPSFTVEWIRKYGLLVSKKSSRGHYYADKMYSSIWSILEKEKRNEDIFALRNYIDEKFNEQSFFQDMIDHFIKRKKYSHLLEYMYTYQQKHARMTTINKQGLSQIPIVNNRIKLYKGFRLKKDSSYFKGSWKKLREKISSKLEKNYYSFDSSAIHKAKDPLIVGLFYENKIYIFSYDTGAYRNKWNLEVYEASEFGSTEYYKNIYNSINFLNRNRNIQIYMNPIGVDLYQYLKKIPDLNIRFFYNFQKNKIDDKKNKMISIRCGNNYQNIEKLTYRLPKYFEGKLTIYDQGNVIWDFSPMKLNNSFNNINEYEWSCGNHKISFQKMKRRVGLKVTPEIVLFTNSTFNRSSLDDVSVEYYFWSEFWMKKGTNALFYLKDIDWKDEKSKSFLDSLHEPINSSEDIQRIQSELRHLGLPNLILIRNIL